MTFKRKLKHIDIEITKKCNLSCLHCSAQSNAKGNELTFGEIRTILDKASLLGLENAGFTGGEPLSHKDRLVKLLKHCKHTLDLKTHLHTNGTLLSLKDAQILAKFADEISITILGSNAQTHDRITSVEGSWKAAQNGLISLLHQNANVRAYLVPMKSNFREFPQIIEMVHQMGCSKFRLLSLSPTGRARESFDTLSLNYAERKWLSEQLLRIRKGLGIDIDAGFCTRQDFPLVGQLPGHQSCLAAEDRVHIDAFGEVFPCTASSGLQAFSGANIRTYAFNLADVWKFSPMFQFFRFFHANPPKKCRSCRAYKQCMGGCRVMMFYRYQDFTVAKPNCRSPKCLS